MPLHCLKSSNPIAKKFLQIVKSITDRSGLAIQSNRTIARIAGLNAAPREQLMAEGNMTQRALDDLLYRSGEEEKAIRCDPIGICNRITGKVFDSVE